MGKGKKSQDKDTKKKSLLDDTLKQIEEQSGKGFTMKFGNRASVEVDAISSGSIKVGEVLGIGGYPKGRIMEVYGPESSGRATLTLYAIAEVRKKGGHAASTDAENAAGPTYAKNLGVDAGGLILSQPDSGEQVLGITEMLIKGGAIDLVIIDSVAALVPQAKLGGEMGGVDVGLQACMMPKAMQKLSGTMNHSERMAIFINQLREKVSTMFGNSKTTSGEGVLEFYSSIRLDTRRGEAVKDGTSTIGDKVNVKVVKNKVAPLFKVAQIEVMYGEEISCVAELLDPCVDHDIVMESGAWLSYNGEEIGQGKEVTKTFIKSNPALMEKLDTKLREKTVSKKTEANEEKREEA